jgi:hypothetical protein
MIQFGMAVDSHTVSSNSGDTFWRRANTRGGTSGMGNREELALTSAATAGGRAVAPPRGALRK